MYSVAMSMVGIWYCTILYNDVQQAYCSHFSFYVSFYFYCYCSFHGPLRSFFQPSLDFVPGGRGPMTHLLLHPFTFEMFLPPPPTMTENAFPSVRCGRSELLGESSSHPLERHLPTRERPLARRVLRELALDGSGLGTNDLAVE